MKKLITLSATILLIALILCLSACGNKSFRCDICGKEKSGKSYKSHLYDQDVTICPDCYDEINKTFQ